MSSAFWRKDDKAKQKARKKANNEAIAFAQQQLDEQKVFDLTQTARLSRSLGLPRIGTPGRRFMTDPGRVGRLGTSSAVTAHLVLGGGS